MKHENKTTNFRSRLEELVGNEKPFPWASKIGLTPGVFNRMWNDGTAPKGDVLQLIAGKTGCSLDWLLLGEGEKWRPELCQVVPVKDIMLNGFDMRAEGYVNVPSLDTSISTEGLINQNEQVVDYIGFNEDWIKKFLGVSAENLLLIRVKGDSMVPTLSEGDLVLIDTTSKNIVTNSMYVVQFWGSLQIKRVQCKLDGTVVIKSDNNIYEPEIIPIDQVDNLNVIGRVVWYGKRP
ncbi:MAG: helix-turn-helix transcriptional regulator [Deltaproteobacteria bacterium]|nr:helix-turn-helix transcriptional regulator [Deltaproteobacteria bacterium]